MNPPDIMPSATYDPYSAFYNATINNTLGLSAPYPTLVISNYTALAYTDPVTFTFNFNISNTYTNTQYQDPNAVMVFNSNATGILMVYPKAIVNSPNNYFYLTNGISNTTPQVAYSPVADAYCPNGRPFFVQNGVNGNNIMTCMGITTTIVGSTATLVFNFPAINWGGSTTCNYNLALVLTNKGKLTNLSDISTTGFTENI